MPGEQINAISNKIIQQTFIYQERQHVKHKQCATIPNPLKHHIQIPSKHEHSAIPNLLKHYIQTQSNISLQSKPSTKQQKPLDTKGNLV
jgi:hypothetical protein